MIGSIKNILLLSHLTVHNANALSSPYTIGFPAMTAWLGAVHAIQRKLNDRGFSIALEATGVISHNMDLQTYRGTEDYVSSIIGTANPLDKSGSRSAFIEEARCHLDASLVIECSGIDKDEEEAVKSTLSHILNTNLKISGGHIQTFYPPELFRVEEGNDQDVLRFMRKLMPGYALVERRDLMIHAMRAQREAGQPVDALNALIDYLAVHHVSEKDDDGNVTWRKGRRDLNGQSCGWIVPIATGFYGISAIGQAQNQRDPDVPHRFAESVVTLGEFKMPYRFDRIEDILWRYHHDEESDMYVCQQSTNSSCVDGMICDESDPYFE